MVDVTIVVYLAYRNTVGQETWKKWREAKERQYEPNQFLVSSVLYLPHRGATTKLGSQ